MSAIRISTPDPLVSYVFGDMPLNGTLSVSSSNVPATAVTHNTVGYLYNSGTASPSPYSPWFFDYPPKTENNFDKLVDIFDLWYKAWNTAPNQKLCKELSTGSYPPADIYEDKDKNLVYKFAVAGYTEDEIDIEFDDDRLYLYLQAREEDKEERREYLQKGIKRGKAEVSYFTPFERYDVAKTTAQLKDGFLIVTVPIKEEEKPIKIGINK